MFGERHRNRGAIKCLDILYVDGRNGTGRLLVTLEDLR